MELWSGIADLVGKTVVYSGTFSALPAMVWCHGGDYEVPCKLSGNVRWRKSPPGTYLRGCYSVTTLTESQSLAIHW